MKLRLLAGIMVGAFAACSDGNGPPTSHDPESTITLGSSVASTTTHATAAPTTSTPDPNNADISLVAFATGLDKPVAFAARPGSPNLFVVEQYVGVRLVHSDGTVGDLVLDLRGKVSTGSEQGALGLAFALDGSNAYVNFTDRAGDTHVVEYAMKGDNIVDGSERELIFVEQPASNHNGGDLKVGADGMLYIALGDGGGAGDPSGNGQNRSSRLGKILRINPTEFGSLAYSVPSDNPFRGHSATAGEIWAYGLRNPWRFSFDRATGDMWIADVGQNTYEEIDIVRAGDSGTNFGWNAREGFHAYNPDVKAPDAVDPVFETRHDAGNCSITGGFVYRGSSIPDLVGNYVFTDFCNGNLLALDMRSPKPEAVALDLHVDQVSSFGEDNAAELYVLSRTGTIHKLVHL